MRTLKIIYWISTVIFGGFMIFSAVPDLILTDEANKFITGLGYPSYIIPFLGLAKILGALTIIIPITGRIKDWAYAGLFFDLIGAVYSMYMIMGFNSGHLFMGFLMAVGAVSYFTYLRIKNLRAVSTTSAATAVSEA
jgi:hypothetical protein